MANPGCKWQLPMFCGMATPDRDTSPNSYSSQLLYVFIVLQTSETLFAHSLLGMRAERC